jgi:hypothetical protein
MSLSRMWGSFFVVVALLILLEMQIRLGIIPNAILSLALFVIVQLLPWSEPIERLQQWIRDEASTRQKIVIRGAIAGVGCLAVVGLFAYAVWLEEVTNIKVGYWLVLLLGGIGIGLILLDSLPHTGR